MEQILTALASHGAVGLLAAALLWLLVRKDNELTIERAARVKDAQDYTRLALELSDKIHETVERVDDIADKLRRNGS